MKRNTEHNNEYKACMFFSFFSFFKLHSGGLIETQIVDSLSLLQFVYCWFYIISEVIKREGEIFEPPKTPIKRNLSFGSFQREFKMEDPLDFYKSGFEVTYISNTLS